VSPFPGVKLGIGWGGGAAGNTKQGTKCVEWIESSIEAEREFVQVGLKVLMANTMMCAK